MIQITHEQREEKLLTGNGTQRDLYESYAAAQRLGIIAIKHNLKKDHLSFRIAVGDVILGLVPQEKLPELLIERLGVERPAAMRITADVLDFLAPLDQPEATETATAVPINNVESTNDNSLANDIAEAEAAMESMQPIRTMSHDMEVKRGAPVEEPTHTAASQADLLDRTATIKDKNPDSRWGTEQT